LQKQGKIEHGTVILADEQTAGRGQRGAEWSSKAGENLLLSIFLKPDNLSVENQHTLNYFVSLSIIHFLRKIGILAKVKWPNDIYVGNKKLAGILIENTISQAKINSSIVGIGLNVNQNDFQQMNATSIQKETNTFHPLNSLLFSLIYEMNELWGKRSSGAFEPLKQAYLANMYLINEKALFEDAEGSFMGEIVGIDSQGLLQIVKNSKIVNYNLKEIKFIIESES
jgi:BirA family biotin operon repressor/biotin-[acetyl-CoA-carboxylase] ligase